MVLLLLLSNSWGEPDELQGSVVNVTVDGFYIDLGSSDGVQVGDRVTVSRAGVLIAQGQVVTVTLHSSLVQARVVDDSDILPGDDIEATATAEPNSPQRPGNLAGEDQGFVPLLTTPPASGTNLEQTRNVWKGRLRLSLDNRLDTENDFDSWGLRLGGNGSLLRIQGTPWYAEWNVATSLRGGGAFSNSPDNLTDRWDVYRMFVARNFEQQGFLRFGRFLTDKSPEVGYLDGIQWETVNDETWIFGIAAGLKPRRIDLSPSPHEPTVTSYITANVNNDWVDYYGTYGFLFSTYQGSPDRLATYTHHSARFNPLVDVSADAIVDFDIGGTELRGGSRLTQMRLQGRSRVLDPVELEAGLEHFETPDTAAERDALSNPTDDIFDDGFWRLWFGARESLGEDLQLSQRVTWIYDNDQDDRFRWQLSASQKDPFDWEDTRVNISIFNIGGQDSEGYGVRVTASARPLQELNIRAGLGYRRIDYSELNQEANFGDVSVGCDYRLSTRWNTGGTLGYSFGDNVSALTLNVTISYAW